MRSDPCAQSGSILITVTMSANCEEFNLEDNFSTSINILKGIKFHHLSNNCFPDSLSELCIDPEYFSALCYRNDISGFDVEAGQVVVVAVILKGPNLKGC